MVGNKKNGSKSPVSGFTADRFLGRVHGFTWAIIETRDPNYDGEKLKKDSIGILMLKACSFGTPIEMNLFTQIIEKSKVSPKSNNEEFDYIQGALEGKIVVYDKKDPELLLLNQDIGSKSE